MCAKWPTIVVDAEMKCSQSMRTYLDDFIINLFDYDCAKTIQKTKRVLLSSSPILVKTTIATWKKTFQKLLVSRESTQSPALMVPLHSWNPTTGQTTSPLLFFPMHKWRSEVNGSHIVRITLILALLCSIENYSQFAVNLQVPFEKRVTVFASRLSIHFMTI
jgi:hypothetical protein